MTGSALVASLVALAVACAAGAVRLRAPVDVAARVGVAFPSPPHPPPSRAWLERLGRVGPLRRVDRSRPAELLRAIGSERSSDELVGWRVGLAAALGITVAVLPWPAPLASPLLVAVGARAPDAALARAVARRRRAAARELPDVLDMLAAAATAGLPGPLALRRAASVTDGPLSEDLRRAFEAVDLGARWKDEVDDVARRLELGDLHRVVATLARGEALGSAMADALRALADDVREARRSAAADRARRAPVKMLFPLVFLVLPAFLLLTVVPVLVTTLGSIR
ncbi:MAG: type II secretion system F family protein [Candidatus Velamenicoccus archaeovorus]